MTTDLLRQPSSAILSPRLTLEYRKRYIHGGRKNSLKVFQVIWSISFEVVSHNMWSNLFAFCCTRNRRYAMCPAEVAVAS